MDSDSPNLVEKALFTFKIYRIKAYNYSSNKDQDTLIEQSKKLNRFLLH